MLHKIRYGMVDRDRPYELKGVIEIDDSFFGGGAGGDKRGRGTQKTPVIIEASTNKDAVGFARMRVVKTMDKKTIQKGCHPGCCTESDD